MKNRQLKRLSIFFDKKFCWALFICKFAIPFGEVCNALLKRNGRFFKIKIIKPCKLICIFAD